MDHPRALRVLGLPGPATAEQVKTTYRRLARERHPDLGGDEQAFRDLQAAYEALRHGTQAVAGGPPPQVHAAAVDRRWWDGPGEWHTDPVEHDGLDPHGPLPSGRSTRADVELVARLVAQRHGDWRLHSRAPGAWSNRLVPLLDADLLAALDVVPATDGRRAGHDLVARLRAPGGRGRRVAADATLPDGWVRARGSDVVQLERRLRPSRATGDTAVRSARVVAQLCDELGWPLREWSLVRDEGR